MWIILIIIVILFLFFRTLSKKKKAIFIQEYSLETNSELQNFLNNSSKDFVDEKIAKQVATKIYKLSFYKAGKKPFDFTQMNFEPQKLIRQQKYLRSYKVTLKALIEAANTAHNLKLHTSETESQEALDEMLNGIKTLTT